MTRRVLVVEDDVDLAASLRALLEGEGYEVVVARSLAEARAADARAFHVVLLDWRLPDGEGIDFLRELRKVSDVPVLMVTARVDVIDRVLGLEIGADDYVTKPAEPRELLARIKARLRGRDEDTTRSRVLAAHGIRVDVDARAVTFRARPVTLTKMELDLLIFFLRSPGRVFSRDELLNQVWGFERAPTTRTVDTHVGVLRSKLSPELFESVRGIGYRFMRDFAGDDR